MSAVWNYFRKTNDGFGNLIGICTLCQRPLKIPKSKTTTNLLGHLRTSHGEELGNITRKRGFEAGNYGNPTFDDPRTAVHRSLARLVVEGAIPIETTALKPFHDFCAAMSPSYRPPPLRILRSLLDEEGCRLEMANRMTLADMSSIISLLVDLYYPVTSNQGFLLVGAQLLSRASLEKRIIVLDVVPVDDDSGTMSETVVSCLRKLDVDLARIGTVVANEIRPLQELALCLRTKFVPCAANAMCLVVGDTLHMEPCAATIARLRFLVSEFQRNRAAKMQLRSRQRECKLPEVTLAVDTPDRWITTYSMICDFMITLPVFTELMGRMNLPKLQEGDVHFLEALRTFLEPFYSLTKQVCAKDATASVFLAVGRILITTTEKHQRESVGEAQRFAQLLCENTSKYFTPWLGDEFLQLAAFLDPRFAYLETVQPMKSWTATVEKFIAHHQSMHPPREEAQGGSGSSLQQSQRQQTSVWEILRENQDAPSTSSGVWNQGDELRAELQHYGGILRTSRPAFNTDPILWWRAYMLEFPILAAAAFSHLATPATTVDCQRLLSLVSESPAVREQNGPIRKTDRLLLTLKAHLHKDVSRECKAWTIAEVRNFGCSESASVDDMEEDLNLSTVYRSDEEKTVFDAGEPLMSYVEEDDLDNMKNRQS
ncbi:unnamed protein product [Cylicocyclus nassatus]|uniref:BED-type domain-containing protein n=1 Tax=Cylicocyclus nassatus TaxID=53992 RepID=A0AA36MA00_CYLNA|nr:unnamed protein product [Cylicocyclus nassatus]